MKRKKKGTHVKRRVLVFCLLLAMLLSGAYFLKTAISIQPDRQLQAEHGTTKTKKEVDWRLQLVNEENPLPEGFSVETCPISQSGQAFDKRAAQNLERMLADGKKQGMSFVVCSSYRSIDKQKTLFKNQVQKQKRKGLSEEEAYKEAKTVVALPGTSEHNYGLAADIVAKSYQMLDDKQAQTKEAKWLKENCAKYGFILRYPLDKKDKTGIIFEPWHYRYVGEDAAKEIMRRGICLEEYLEERA